jgi:hypothetical protein
MEDPTRKGAAEYESYGKYSMKVEAIIAEFSCGRPMLHKSVEKGYFSRELQALQEQLHTSNRWCGSG